MGMQSFHTSASTIGRLTVRKAFNKLVHIDSDEHNLCPDPWPVLCWGTVVDKTPCLQCGRVGLIRFEVVVKGRETSLTYYCGYCEHIWQAKDRRIMETNRRHVDRRQLR
jgi:hypothetical protein